MVPWPDTNHIINAIAAIGHPQRFFDDLRDRGYEVHGKGYTDHYLFKAHDLPQGRLIMTAKDAVKCRPLAQGTSGQPTLQWLYATQALTIAPAQIDALLLKLGIKPNHTNPQNKDLHG